MGNTAKICLDLSGKYNKEEIDRVSEMLLEAADPEQQELFAIPVSHQIPAVFAAVCMSIFLAIDQEVAAKGAHSLNPEDLTERFINVIKRLALGYGVSKEEFNREGGFRDRAMEAIKEIGSFNLHLHSTGKTAGFFPAAQESDTISEL
ncbi:MAG: hypothetical protein LLG06_04050, partial [Desulfobacteraceae bacterium]|nr:hypothetical protein [Desulfobacteraceae bacterium]